MSCDIGQRLEYPEIDLRLAASYETVDFKRATDIDAGVRFGDGNWSGLYRRRLSRERVFPVCSPDFRSELKKPLDFGVLHDCRILCMTDPYDEWPEWCESVNPELPDLSSNPRYNELLMLYRAAKEGQGVALARNLSIESQLQTGSLVSLFESSVASKFNYYFVCPEGHEQEPKIAKFLSRITEKARRSSVSWNEP